MAFTLSNLLQNVYTDLGQIDRFGLFPATGGSATTFINTAFSTLESPPEETSLVNKLAIVTYDAGGAGASPEGKYGIVSAYVESTQTATIPTVTDAIAANDKIMVASQASFPYQVVEFQANRALSELGDIALVDTSLTAGSNQTEYAVPVALKRRPPRRIYYNSVTGDTNNYQWIEIRNWRFEAATPGSTGLLYLPQIPADRTIRILYDGVHPALTTYASVISETIHPRVAVAATIVKVLEWYNRQDGNQDPQSYFLWLEGEYRNKHLPMALLENPIWKPEKGFKPFIRGGHKKRDLPPEPFVT